MPLMDRISRHSWASISSSVCDLQDALEWFAAECEAAWMKISTSKYKAIILCLKMDYSLQVGVGVAAKAKVFKYLKILFMSGGKMEHRMDRQSGTASAVMRVLYRTIMVERKLSWEAKLLIYQLIYVLTLTYGYEL